jgi:hypothetical protein
MMMAHLILAVGEFGDKTVKYRWLKRERKREGEREREGEND